jgi:hypothetical protein
MAAVSSLDLAARVGGGDSGALRLPAWLMMIDVAAAGRAAQANLPWPFCRWQHIRTTADATARQAALLY